MSLDTNIELSSLHLTKNISLRLYVIPSTFIYELILTNIYMNAYIKKFIFNL